MAAPQVNERDDHAKRLDLEETLRAFISDLLKEATDRVQARVTIERRWLDDLRQYHGKYDDRTWRSLKDRRKSRVFLNLTRPKTNAMMARLWDLLFPTDDRNWEIRPTPVPELSDELEEKLEIARDAADTFNDRAVRKADAESRADGQPGAAQDEADLMAEEMEAAEDIRKEAQDAADALSEQVREAERRCRLMEKEIEDQLTACGFQGEARKAIRDACKIGTGILKGPILSDKGRKRWVNRQGENVVPFPEAIKKRKNARADIEDDETPLVLALEDYQSDTPSVEWVDPWSYFPQMDSSEPEDSESVYQRHLLKPHQLRKLARRPDIDANAVRRILEKGPNMDAAPSYLVELRDVTEQRDIKTDNLYQVWEYTGPIEAEKLELVSRYMGQEGISEYTENDDVDPLDEIHVRIWFCQDQIFSIAPHPLDSGETIYSVFNLQEDESSQFGFGIPYLMRHEQSAINAAKRMMMDNSGYSTGPQIVINKKLIEPADGDVVLEGSKEWWLNDVDQSESPFPPFQSFDIPSHQAELANLIELQRQDIDEVTSLPQIAQGEQGTGVTKTAQGMALLMNSANVGFRMFVKNFDDNMTVPMIGRMYDFNMQFSSKDAIKGDYQVDARGSSVLLVREMQANNLMMIMTGLGDHPRYGLWLREENMLRDLFRAHNMNSDQQIKTREEYERDAEAQAQQEDPVVALEKARAEMEKARLQLEQHELELKAEMHNAEWAARREIAQLEYAKTMGIAVEKLNVELDKAELAAQQKDKDRESGERKMAVEVAVRDRTGVSSGGAV